MSITFSGLKGSKNRLYDNSKTAFAVAHKVYSKNRLCDNSHRFLDRLAVRSSTNRIRGDSPAFAVTH